MGFLEKAEPITFTYMVWRQERTLQRLMLKTQDLEKALTMLESLQGKKKYAYIYYIYNGKFKYLCGTLDNKWSRKDWRMAVKQLLARKSSRVPRGLWSNKRAIA